MGNLQATLSQRRHCQAVLLGIKNGSVKFRDLPEESRDDGEIALAAIRRDGYSKVCEHVSDRLKSNKAFVLAAVKLYGSFLGHASEELRDDRDVVLEAVREHGCALQHASEELRADREIVLAAIRRNGYALEFASDEWRDNRDVVLEVVRETGAALQYASQELRGDREIVLEAVRQNGKALQFASEELRADQEIVLEAVQQRGSALQYAEAELLANREFVLTALDIIEKGPTLEYVLERALPRDLQNDPIVAGALLRKGARLRHGSEIMERLGNALLALQVLPVHFVNGVVDEESVVEDFRQWEHSIWQKIWMALQLEPPGMHGIGRLFVEQSGLPLQLRKAKELLSCAPVIGAVRSLYPQDDWKDLSRRYPVRNYHRQNL